MEHKVESFNKWLYPDDTVLSSSKNKVANLVLPGNGYGSFQVIIDGCAVGAEINWLSNAEENFSVEVYREIPVTVTQNTGVKGFTTDYKTAKAYVTRRAPFEVYDALEPASECKVKNPKEAFYICFKADKNANPGNYEAHVAINIGEEKIEIPVSLEITKTTLPKESLYLTNWFTLCSMAKSHGLELWSEEHWAMIEKYGKAMRRGRQNVFWVTWDTVQSNFENGKYVFDFSRTERLIRSYLGMGFTVIEGAPICNRDSWGSEIFKVNILGNMTEALSEKGRNYISNFLNAWNKFLKEKGWYGFLVQHVGDEPHEKCAKDYKILSDMFRKFLPDVPIIEAIETYDLQGAVDIWVPKNDYYSRNIEHFEKLKLKGDRVWFYTCCIPGGFYMNRLLDMPLLRTRFLHWGNYKYDIEGFLHWGLNHWRENQNPFKETTPLNSPTEHLPAGDTNILYPGKSGPLISMRLEQMRAGAEDYELLKKLAFVDKKKADEIVAECFTAFDKCNPNAENFDKLHKKLLRMPELRD